MNTVKLALVFLLIPWSISAQNTVNTDSLKEIFSQSNDVKLKAEATIELARYYNGNNSDSAAKFLDFATELANELGDEKLQAKTLLYRANYLQNLAFYEQSIAANQEALKLYEKLKDNHGIASAYNTLGLTYKKNSGDNRRLVPFSKKALEYEYKALEYYKIDTKIADYIRVYSNIGIIHRDLEEYEKAEQSYLLGIKKAEEVSFTGHSLGVLKANLSQIYLDHYKNYDRAIELLNEALLNYQQNDVLNSQEHAYRNLAYNYSGKGEHQKAISSAERAVEIAIEVKDPHRQRNAYGSLFEANKAAGNFQDAMKSLEIEKGLIESNLSIEKTSVIAEMNAKFETVKKDAEIQVLTKTNEVNRWRIWALVAGLITLLSLAFILIQKRKKDRLIFAQEKAIEEEKREKAEQALEAKKKELTTKVLQLASKNDFLSSLESEIETLKTNVDSSVNKTSSRISRMIKRDIANDKQWLQFSSEFSSIHGGFIAALAAKHGNFSKSEVRLISLLKMNLSSKEIAGILSISDDGIKKARYRLRKKMKLEDSELQSYLLNFSV